MHGDLRKERCLELMLAGELNQKQIAEELGCTESTISKWKHDEEFQATFRKELRLLMSGEAPAAITRIVKLSKTAESESVRLNANKMILDKAGLADKTELEITGTKEITVSLED